MLTPADSSVCTKPLRAQLISDKLTPADRTWANFVFASSLITVRSAAPRAWRSELGNSWITPIIPTERITKATITSNNENPPRCFIYTSSCDYLHPPRGGIQMQLHGRHATQDGPAARIGHVDRHIRVQRRIGQRRDLQFEPLRGE